jgi:hypothetical protein
VKIHRSRPPSGFTIIPDETLRDDRLSYAARGVLAEILSRPDDWSTNADALWRRGRHERGKAAEGRNAMRSLFAELEKAGYMARHRKRAARGRMITELHIFDAPVERGPDGTPVVLAAADFMAGTDAHPSGRRSEQAEPESPQVAPTYRRPGVGPPGVGRPGVGGPGVYTETYDGDLGTEIFKGNRADKDTGGPAVNSSVEGSGNGQVKTGLDVIEARFGRPDGLTDEQWAEIAFLAPAAAELTARHRGEAS